MGSAAVETRVTAPPPIFVGGPTMILLPPIWEVYNNSNLVNNEVFKKLTTKLISKHEILWKPCLISLAKPLNSTSWLSAIFDYRIQSVAAPGGGDPGNVPPEHKSF